MGFYDFRLLHLCQFFGQDLILVLVSKGVKYREDSESMFGFSNSFVTSKTLCLEMCIFSIETVPSQKLFWLLECSRQ